MKIQFIGTGSVRAPQWSASTLEKRIENLIIPDDGQLMRL